MRLKSLDEIKHTNFDSCYLNIYALKTNINCKNDNTFTTKSLYSFFGLNSLGKRRFIGCYIEDKENNRFWLDVFENFKKRGINDILFMCVDSNTSFIRCLKTSFPNVIVVPSIIYIMDKFYYYFSDKFSTKIKEEIKALFIQENVKDFINIFSFFTEKYNNNIILLELINKYLSNIQSLYKFDLNIRNALFNNYKIDIIKRKIINISIQFGYIDNIDDLLNAIIDDLNALENFSSYHKKEWLNILSSFYTLRNKELENLL